MLAAVAVSAALSILPPAETFSLPEEDGAGVTDRSACALPAIAKTLRRSENWQDMGSEPRRGTEVEDELAAQGSGLVFRHRPSAGVLLVEAQFVVPEEAAPEAYWRETAATAQEMCVENGLECEVAALEGAPFGLQASTRIPDGAQVIRRETLSFSDGRDCGYSVQFTGEQSAFSETGWQAVRSALLKLRRLIVPVRQSRR